MLLLMRRWQFAALSSGKDSCDRSAGILPAQWQGRNARPWMAALRLDYCLISMKRHTHRERLFRRGNCLLNILACMRCAQEGGLELRRRKINAVVEDRPEKPPECFGIGSCGGIPVRNRPGGEEPREHGTHAVVANGHARIFGGGGNPRHQFSTHL